MSAHEYTRIYIYIYIYMYIYISIYVYIEHIYICIYSLSVHIYIYIHMYYTQDVPLHSSVHPTAQGPTTFQNSFTEFCDACSVLVRDCGLR